jgi:hypothetical protein
VPAAAAIQLPARIHDGEDERPQEEHAGPRVLAFEQARGAQVRRSLRLDPLGLRHHLPDVVVKRVFPVLARVVRRRVHGDGGLPAVRPGDFTVHGDDLERPRDLLRQWRR